MANSRGAVNEVFMAVTTRRPAAGTGPPFYSTMVNSDRSCRKGENWPVRPFLSLADTE